jgi:hypothetical protein
VLECLVRRKLAASFALEAHKPQMLLLPVEETFDSDRALISPA